MKNWVNLYTLKTEHLEDIIMAVTSEIAKSLKALRNTWKDTEPRTGFATIPDNDYLAKLVDMEVALSKNKRTQVVTTFQIADGKYKKTEIKKFDGIDSDVSISWFKGYCEVLGLEIPEDLMELPDVLEEFVEDNKGDLFRISLKTKDEYQNITVKGPDTGDLEEQPEEEPEGEPEEEEEDDKKKKRKEREEEEEEEEERREKRKDKKGKRK